MDISVKKTIRENSFRLFHDFLFVMA